MANLEQKFIHIPSGETIVVCTGVVLVDGLYDIKRINSCSWKFLQPESVKQKESKVVKKSSNQSSIDELRNVIESMGYQVPDSYGLILNTELSNITIKKKKIIVRVNSTTSNPASFSFQYQPNSITSYHDAIDNALALRDHLLEERAQRYSLNKRVNEANDILKVIKGHKES